MASLNVHFSQFITNLEASKRIDVSASCTTAAGELALWNAQHIAHSRLQRAMSSTVVSPSALAPGAGQASSASSTNLLGRLERVTSARRSQTESSGKNGQTAAVRQPSVATPKSFAESCKTLDEDSGIVHKKKFNKVHSLRMTVSGSPDQQAAKQLYEEEKKLRLFINTTKPVLPK